MKTRKTFLMIIPLAILIMGIDGMTRADIVQFPLACEGEYPRQPWKAHFDVETTFIEISNVYIDWSGEITAELVVPCGSPPGTPTQSLDGLFMATLYETDPHNYFGRAYVQGGGSTSPDPEPFLLRSEFTEFDWSSLLDGEANIEIGLCGVIRLLYLCTVKPPEGKIDSAVLVIDGIVPEPSTLSLMFIGMLGVRAR